MKTNENSTANVQNNGQNAIPTTLIRVDSIDLNPKNPRGKVKEETIVELADNINNIGLIESITVRTKGDRYELICGERRYRAVCYLAWESVPAKIFDVDDEQAYDMAVSENLQRENINIIREAQAYIGLKKTGRYDDKSLSLHYGKSTQYIGQLLKLENLIPQFAELTEEEKIPDVFAKVLCRFNKKIQKRVFAEKINADCSGDWVNITASILDKKIKETYANNLDVYNFDKTECLTCAHNLATYDMFACDKGCGTCQNSACLDKKNSAFVSAKALEIVKADPLVKIAKDHREDAPEKAILKVAKEGYEIPEQYSWYSYSFPTLPIEPAENATDEEKEQYTAKLAEYDDKIAKINSDKEKGKIEVFAVMTNNNVVMRYQTIDNDKSSKKTADKTNVEMIQDLRSKRIRNNEIAVEKSIIDLKEHLIAQATPTTPITTFEDNLMYYYMLKDLRKVNWHLFGLELPKESYGSITDEQRKLAMTKLTPELKAVIVRDFITPHMTSSAFTVGEPAELLRGYGAMHFPEKTEVIYADHKEVYDKKNERLNERVSEYIKLERKAREKTTPAVKVAEGKKTPKTAGKVKEQPKNESAEPKKKQTKPTGKAA